MSTSIYDAIAGIFIVLALISFITLITSIIMTGDYTDGYIKVWSTEFVLTGTYNIGPGCDSSLRCSDMQYSAYCDATTPVIGRDCVYSIYTSDSQAAAINYAKSNCISEKVYNGYYGSDVCYAIYPNHSKKYYSNADYWNALCGYSGLSLIVSFLLGFIFSAIADSYRTKRGRLGTGEYQMINQHTNGNI